MIRLSTTTYEWEVFKDKDLSVPYDDLSELTGLIIIAKKKAADADDDAIFTIEQGDMSIADNVVTFTITSDMTASLPKAKETTATLELVKTDPPRQTIGEPTPVTIYPSYKDE